MDGSGSGSKMLLGPLARAAGFVAARHRQRPEDGVVEVPVHATCSPCCALLYDELPADCTETLAVLAEVGNMWCAPRLTYFAVDALTACMGFFDVFDLAGDWPEVRPLLRYHAIEFLPCLAKDPRVAELADILWTCT